MEALLYYVSWACLLLGAGFCFVGGLGLLRLPDFYSRMHGGGVTDTLGAGLILLGLMFQSGLSLATVKLVMIGLFLLLAGPRRHPRHRPRGAAEWACAPRHWGGTMTVALVDIALMTFLAVIAVAITQVRDLFAAVVLTGIFSLLSACIFTSLDAVDVAFTEAAVGAGLATVLFLAALTLTGPREKTQPHHSWSGLCVCLLTGGALIYGTLDMPHLGDPNAPIHQHVAPRYIAESPEEIGIPNMVTSVLASYRGYDTLGEVTVIFTAGLAVLLLLRGSGTRLDAVADQAMQHAMILRVASKLFIPLILLFALYVQFHGDFGPGGGFQAGVIFAAAFVLYALIYGVEEARRVAPAGRVQVFFALGLLLYIGTGVACLLAGGNFLEYKVLASDPTHGEHYGILLIELGVGITVAAVVISIFCHFASRGRP